MKSVANNAKWLMWFTPFRSLSISAAYLTPFFLQYGLNQTQIFALQTLFSVATVLWELPSGYLADKFGRAFCIKLSAPIAAAAFIAYGLSTNVWEFAICELVLALANGLISGVDDALLADSLKAAGQSEDFTKVKQRIQALGFASTALAVPVAIALVSLFGVPSTIIADGVLTACGIAVVMRLTEAPILQPKEQSVWVSLRQLAKNQEVRWLVALTVALGTGTYMSFWLSAPYYQSVHVPWLAPAGIPVVAFSAILAVRSLGKAWLAHRHYSQRHLARKMVAYALLLLVGMVAMASSLWWLMPLIACLDIVQALQVSPLVQRMNAHMHSAHRATLNSAVNLVGRLSYAVVGPFVGAIVDHQGLAMGLVVTGIGCSAVALVATLRLVCIRGLS